MSSVSDCDDNSVALNIIHLLRFLLTKEIVLREHNYLKKWEILVSLYI